MLGPGRRAEISGAEDCPADRRRLCRLWRRLLAGDGGGLGCVPAPGYPPRHATRARRRAVCARYRRREAESSARDIARRC